MKYAMTSSGFTGSVVFEFDDKSNLLLSYSISDAELSDKQQVWLLKNLPREMAEIKDLLAKSPTVVFEEINEVVTFDMFWITYDDKTMSSKKRTLKAWNKLSEANQIRAFNFIKKYTLNLPVGTRKKYAETYLNAELWNN